MLPSVVIIKFRKLGHDDTRTKWLLFIFSLSPTTPRTPQKSAGESTTRIGQNRKRRKKIFFRKTEISLSISYTKCGCAFLRSGRTTCVLSVSSSCGAYQACTLFPSPDLLMTKKYLSSAKCSLFFYQPDRINIERLAAPVLVVISPACVCDTLFRTVQRKRAK